MALDLGGIRKATRRVSEFARRNPKSPGSGDVHKLRTSIRHLKTALVALRLDSKRSVGSLLRGLRKVRRRAGRVRDMDVLTAKALTVDRSGEQDCLVRLLEHLGAERNKRARKLRQAIKKRRRKLRRGLERVERSAGRTGKDKDAGAAPDVAARALRLSSALSRPGRLGKDNLHEYRLRVKELRDVLRLSDRAADSALVKRLEAVKDAIGDWHDWVELTDIAADRLDHGASCELVRHLETIRDSRYRHALSLTRALIERHLRAKPRKRRKPAAARAPIATPVLETVAVIAQEGDSARAE